MPICEPGCERPIFRTPGVNAGAREKGFAVLMDECA